jgi:hypothetical protein
VLTIREQPGGLIGTIDHLLKSFARLRATKWWKKRVKGGAAAVEIKRGKYGGGWHCHLHCLLLVPFLDHGRLSKLWYKASCGSYIVYARPIAQTEKAVGYITKYATKGWTGEIVQDHDSLLECIVALRGRRLLCTFGAWRKCELDEYKPDRDGWSKRWRLSSLVSAAARGEVWAAGVLRAIGVVAIQQADGYSFASLRPDAVSEEPLNDGDAVDVAIGRSPPDGR